MFALVWAKIEQYQGHEFHTISGKPFRYTVKYGCVVPDRTNHQLANSHFEAAWAMGQLERPSDIAKQDPRIRGTSYIWAILNDPRISR